MNFFGFPNPVNELAARTVAAGVLLLTVTTIILTITVSTGWLWLTVPLAYGFIARVLSGPRFSPLGQLATRVAAPRLGPARLVAGPPKRFAQSIGATLTTTAAILHFAFAADRAALVILGLVGVAATLESVFAICIGCTLFGRLMTLGMIPEATCVACADISARIAATA